MFNVKRIGIIFSILALVGLVGLGTALAAPPPPKVDTTSTILDSPSGQTAAVGTVVTITGHAETGDGDPVTGGKIQIKELMLNGLGVPCDTEDAVYESLNQGGDPPDSNGDVFVLFDTTGLAGSVIGFQSHYIPSGGAGYKQSTSECVNLTITDREALPRGTTTYGQGYYAQAQQGELDTCNILARMDRDLLAEMSVDAISGITAILYSESVGVDVTTLDVTTLEDVDRLCSFLVEAGEVNHNNDGGFLPAGKVNNHPVSNLAAQDITLRLNLNLSPVLLLDEEFPIYVGYYLNVDPVSDPDGDMVYPLGLSALGACGVETATIEGLCSEGTDADLTALGALVLRLDDASTTVEDMLAAADSLLLSGDDDILVNRVTLTQGDVTEILSLINESYDEGIPTGFVTAFDAD